MFLGGMLIMTYNMFKTIAAGTPVDAPIPDAAVKPAPQTPNSPAAVPAHGD
jgi:cbb3-type cytochrome oxidase subunit 1